MRSWPQMKVPGLSSSRFVPVTFQGPAVIDGGPASPASVGVQPCELSLPVRQLVGPAERASLTSFSKIVPFGFDGPSSIVQSKTVSPVRS